MASYMLDTSVVISEPHLTSIYPDSDLWISSWILHELDKLKNGSSAASFLARECIRTINELLTSNSAERFDLDCIVVKNNTRKIIFYNDTNHYTDETSDCKIILSYLQAIKKYIGTLINVNDCFLVSKDTNMRNISIIQGLNAIDYITNKDMKVSSYNGVYYLMDERTINMLYTDKVIPIELSGEIIRSDGKEFELKNNDYMLVCAKGTTPFTQNSMSILVKYNNGSLHNITTEDKVTEYIKPKNYKQRFAVNALFDDEIKVLFLIGGAGTGKTLLSLSAGLEQVLELKKYDKIVIIRPNIVVGEDIGYLPGSASEKISPYTMPIIDNLNYIFKYNSKEKNKLTVEFLKEYIEFVPLPFIRGRTFHDSYIIVDESQNLTFLEAKTIITRIGENSKIVFTGDVSQIDRTYLDSTDNGLSILSTKLRNHNLPFVSVVHLNQSERSSILKKMLDIL